jgi:glycolate oxidase
MQKQGLEETNHLDELCDRIYKAAVDLGGVITGEHGIGKTRTTKVERYLSGTEIQLMRSMKRIFDPNNIMNPGAKIPL